MKLVEVGIVMKCLCGAGMDSDMANVLFDDRGRVKIGRRPVHCSVCDAIYRYGERVKYQLVPMDVKISEERYLKRRYMRQNRHQGLEVTLSR